MDKHTEHYTRLVKQVFGPDSRAETSAGTQLAPGAVSIYLGDRLIGQAETFQDALQRATEEIGLQHRRKKT